MFENSFRPYMVLRMLHFLRYPFKMSILTRTVHFRRLDNAPLTLTLLFVARYLNSLSKSTNLISLAFIFCQCFGVKQCHATVKCNIQISFSHIITLNAA